MSSGGEVGRAGPRPTAGEAIAAPRAPAHSVFIGLFCRGGVERRGEGGERERARGNEGLSSCPEQRRNSSSSDESDDGGEPGKP